MCDGFFQPSHHVVCPCVVVSLLSLVLILVLLWTSWCFGPSGETQSLLWSPAEAGLQVSGQTKRASTSLGVLASYVHPSFTNW